MIRTPTKNKKHNPEMTTPKDVIGKEGMEKEKETMPTGTLRTKKLRTTVDEWESRKTANLNPKPQPKPVALLFSPTKKKAPQTQLLKRPVHDVENNTYTRSPLAGSVDTSINPEKSYYENRITEATACVHRARMNLESSKYLKIDIRKEVINILERLHQLVKEAEEARIEIMIGEGNEKSIENSMAKENENQQIEYKEGKDQQIGSDKLIKTIEEHSRLIEKNNENMNILKDKLERYEQEINEDKRTYANVAAIRKGKEVPERTTLHSLKVTGKEDSESGEKILNRIRNAINAKEGGITIENIRKAKDGKVIIGCKTREDRQIVKERLERAEEHVKVEEIKNKNPLVIIRSVFKYNSDEDIIKALHNQNKNLFCDLTGEDTKTEIAYKIRARNPHTNHVVLRVAPRIWKRMIDNGTIHIDLQTLPVFDQSPLVQCSRCLGFGHGKRLCMEQIVKCSHCGGPHMRTECTDWLAGEAPTCCNCLQSKLDTTEHNAFSNKCTIRMKWDALSRSAIAYC